MDVLCTWQLKSIPGDKEGIEVSKQAPSLVSGRWAVCLQYVVKSHGCLLYKLCFVGGGLGKTCRQGITIIQPGCHESMD